MPKASFDRHHWSVHRRNTDRLPDSRRVGDQKRVKSSAEDSIFGLSAKFDNTQGVHHNRPVLSGRQLRRRATLVLVRQRCRAIRRRTAGVQLGHLWMSGRRWKSRPGCLSSRPRLFVHQHTADYAARSPVQSIFLSQYGLSDTTDHSGNLVLQL